MCPRPFFFLLNHSKIITFGINKVHHILFVLSFNIGLHLVRLYNDAGAPPEIEESELLAGTTDV